MYVVQIEENRYGESIVTDHLGTMNLESYEAMGFCIDPMPVPPRPPMGTPVSAERDVDAKRLEALTGVAP
jgi:hypothetical protein